MRFPRVAVWTLLLGMVVSCIAATESPTTGTAAVTTSTHSSSTPIPNSSTNVNNSDVPVNITTNSSGTISSTSSVTATTISLPISTTTVATKTVSLTTSTAAPPANTVTTVTTVSPNITTAANSSVTTVTPNITTNANSSVTTVTTTASPTTTTTAAATTTSTTTSPVTTVTTTASPITSTNSANTVPTTTATSLTTTNETKGVGTISAAQTTPSSSAPTTAAVSPSVIISETNILLTSGQIYVELSGPKHASLNLTVAVYNGSSENASRLFVWASSNVTFNDPGLYLIDATSNSLKGVLAALVVLYKSESYTQDYNSSNLGLDHVLVVTSDTGISSKMREELRLDQSDNPEKNVMFINSTEATSKVLTLTRCQDKDAFLLLPSSFGQINNCSLQAPQSYSLKMTVPRNSVCDEVKKITDSPRKIAVAFIKAFNKYLCGVAFPQLSGNLSCVEQSLLWNFTFQPSYSGQTALFQAKFQTYVASREDFNVGDKTFMVENCTEWKVCYASPIRPPADNDNSRVTVAVVLSFIAVFLVLLIGVIIYMRRRKNGIMRQFRMTRLQEDDDMDDMDDFVGGGFDQEPNFDARNN